MEYRLQKRRPVPGHLGPGPNLRGKNAGGGTPSGRVDEFFPIEKINESLPKNCTGGPRQDAVPVRHNRRTVLPMGLFRPAALDRLEHVPERPAVTICRHRHWFFLPVAAHSGSDLHHAGSLCPLGLLPPQALGSRKHGSAISKASSTPPPTARALSEIVQQC